MSPYPRHVEQTMSAFARSLRENDRRRYAAIEAAKLGLGGVEYIAQVLGIDPKTIRHGQRDLGTSPSDPRRGFANPAGVANARSRRIPRSRPTSVRSSSSTPPAVPPKRR